MNPRELLARLNVPAVRYEIGRGGIPELTNVDIAGALGMMRDEFGREILCALWWPDGGRFRRDWVCKEIRRRVLAEYVARERNYTAAKLEHHIAKCEFDSRRFRTAKERQIVESCEHAVEKAKAQRWPWDSGIYSQFAGVILGEMQHREQCIECKGRGTVVASNLLQRCDKCDGAGIKRQTKTWRADRLGIKEHAYRNTWGAVYTWALDNVRNAESEAAHDLDKILSREEIATCA